MSAPRVSVIIPTYNWSTALRLAVGSALSQSFEDFELLVVGDGCTDDSADVVAEFKDPRVRWKNLESRVGSQSGPNNAGIELARGTYVAYHGHDDLWHRDHLRSLVEILEESEADLAYSGTILYGPPGADIVGVTGLTKLDRGKTLAFVPPTSIAHRCDVARQIGGWRDHRQLTLPVDYDFLLRVWNVRRAFARTGRITVFKFPASWQRDSYKFRRVEQQQALLARMRVEPDFLECELTTVVTAFMEHRNVDVANVDVAISVESIPGRLSELNKRFKGASEERATVRHSSLRISFDQNQPGFEWHAPERHAEYGSFQWTGPSRISSLDLPLATDRDLDLTIHILAPLSDDVLPTLRFSVNDDRVNLDRIREPTGGWLLRGRIGTETLGKSSGETRFTFEIARTVVPADLDPGSNDYRALGLAFHWLELKPCDAREGRNGLP